MIGTIETVSGNFVNVLNPHPDTILLDDIAWSISRISRFAGHTITAVPYTVGQHCVFVYNMLKDSGAHPRVCMFGLLHDAGEAYIGDIPSPVKHIPEVEKKIVEVEDRLLEVIFDKFIGEQPTPEEWKKVKYYDKRAQFIEAHAFMSSRGLSWHDRGEYEISLIDLQTFPAPKPSIEVYADFMDTYNGCIIG